MAVLGAGPLGLSTAYFLGRMGISVTVCDPLDQPGGFLSSVDTKKLPKEILGRETNRLISLANIQLKLGNEYSTLASDGMKQDWRLIIHDQTAHAKDSDPAKSLAMLSSRLSSGRLLLDSTGVSLPDGYKANQIAVAVAAGRELAVQALNSLGFGEQSDELKGLINGGRTGSSHRHGGYPV